MKVSRLKLLNILGHEQLEVTPGKFTAILGKNASGKTSVIEAVKAVLKGGHDATLLRKGAEKGEIVLVLDDGMTITKTVTESDSDTHITIDGRRQNKPATVLKELHDIIAVNPIQFVQADKKRRLEILLEVLDFQVTNEEISAAAGRLLEVKGPALEFLGNVRKTIYDERTGVNRALKEKTSTITQLTETLIPDLQENSDEEAAIYQKELDDLTAKKDTYLQQIQKEKEDAIALANAEYQEKYQSCINRFQEVTEPLKNGLASIDERKTMAAANRKQREIIEQMEHEAALLKDEALKKEAALDALDALKAKMLDNLPIPDLSINNGEIYVNGIEFDRVNTANQIRFALSLARLRAGDLKLVCLDGIETLSESNYIAFREATKNTDLQFIVTRVADTELTVESEG